MDNSSRTVNRLSGWAAARHRQLALPSWLVSAFLHAATLGIVIWVSQTRGCQPDYPGEGGAGFRQVGVYLTTGPAEEDPIAPSEEESTSAATESTSTPPSDSPPLFDGPPIPLERPMPEASPLLGFGSPPDITGHSRNSPSLETTPSGGPPPAAKSVLGKSTSFLGIQDAGRRFVYVLDRSGSMSGGAMRVAKGELMASLENLDATQEFQVIFYNTEAIALVPHSDRFEMFRGIDPHRTEVEQQLGSILAEGGTSHLEALQKALKYNADVIFFLTDADELNLNAEELANITRANNGGARIHCIEFGSHPDLTLPDGPHNSLQKLAAQNGGQYQYRDVKQLR